MHLLKSSCSKPAIGKPTADCSTQGGVISPLHLLQNAREVDRSSRGAAGDPEEAARRRYASQVHASAYWRIWVHWVLELWTRDHSLADLGMTLLRHPRHDWRDGGGGKATTRGTRQAFDDIRGRVIPSIQAALLSRFLRHERCRSTKSLTRSLRALATAEDHDGASTTALYEPSDDDLLWDGVRVMVQLVKAADASGIGSPDRGATLDARRRSGRVIGLLAFDFCRMQQYREA